MAWTSLCELDELREGEGKCVAIDGFELAVFLTGGQVRVIDNTCPHAGAGLSGGWVDDGCVVCPLHGWAFNLATGELRDSAAVAITTYPTRVYDHEGRKLVQADLPMY